MLAAPLTPWSQVALSAPLYLDELVIPPGIDGGKFCPNFPAEIVYLKIRGYVDRMDPKNSKQCHQSPSGLFNASL